MVSEANEPGSESGKRSDDRRGAARGTRAGGWSPQEGGASTPLAAPGSFAAAAMITRTASYALNRDPKAVSAASIFALTSSVSSFFSRSSVRAAAYFASRKA